MAILGGDVFGKHGCYVTFAMLDTPLDIEEGDWPLYELYREGIFFNWDDSLLGAYCGLTRNYAPFDQYALTEFNRPHEVYEFSAKLLMWELQLARTPDEFFAKEYDFLGYSLTGRLTDGVAPASLFKADLLETLHFVTGRLHHAASAGKCVVLVGF